MKRFRTSFVMGATLTCLCASAILSPAIAMTEQQSKGMYRHGIWEWSLSKCTGALRQKGYWYALKELGGFPSSQAIIDLETSNEFKNGWRYMETNARNHGMDRTCDYAFEQWPALLYRN